MVEHYSKLKKVPSMYKTTASLWANVFQKDWVENWGIHSCILTDNGPQFVVKVFSSMRAYLGVKQLTTPAYSSQTNLQIERYNKMISPRLRTTVLIIRTSRMNSYNLLTTNKIRRSVGLQRARPSRLSSLGIHPRTTLLGTL